MPFLYRGYLTRMVMHPPHQQAIMGQVVCPLPQVATHPRGAQVPLVVYQDPVGLVDFPVVHPELDHNIPGRLLVNLGLKDQCIQDPLATPLPPLLALALLLAPDLHLLGQPPIGVGHRPMADLPGTMARRQPLGV